MRCDAMRMIDMADVFPEIQTRERENGARKQLMIILILFCGIFDGMKRE